MPKAERNSLPVLAIDIGGTKILTALVSNENKIIAREYHRTLAHEGTQAVANRLFSAIDHLLAHKNIDLSQLHSISIAAAGAIDLARGIITLTPNIGWRNFPLRDLIHQKYKIKTYLTNDAKAAALCEHELGAGKGVRNLIYITVSTGIGGGIIIDNKLYTGARGSAGEVGHMTIEVNGQRCNCGNIGCWETLASGTAMAEEAKRRIKQGEKSSLTDMVEGKIEHITAEKVEAAARSGDTLAQEVIQKTATYLGIGLVNLVNIFNPEMIVVGGGLSKMGDLLLNPARQVVKERAYEMAFQAVRIVPAQFGDDAGILGAVIFARLQRETDE